MKKALLSLLPILVLLISGPSAGAQCNAAFTWEQIPGTLQIHFLNQSTSEHDIISYQWNFGDGHNGDGANPYHTYTEPGTYLVCLIITDNFGCVDDICHEVTVQPVQSECNAQFTWEQIQNSLQIHFHSTSTSEHDIVSYQWNFGDGHNGDGSNPYHTYDQPGTYLVCLIITDNVGCVSDVCHEVTVAGIPSECNAQFTWEQFAGTLEVDFNSTSTSDHDIISYHWNFGDGHEGDGQSPSHTYTEPGTYLVCLIIENEVGCVSDVCHEVTVAAPSGDCNASFTWEQIPGTLQIHFNSTSTSEHDIVSYHWNFGDNHEGDGSNPYHTYTEPGTYLVCLIIEDNTGCVSDVCHEVTVLPAESDCHADFTWEQIPGTLQIHFHSTSTSQFDIVSYVWHFGDGHSGDGSNPYHTYETPGTYHVCLIITDGSGCVSDVCHDVIVGEPEGGCHAAFEWELIPGSLGVHFINHSTSEHDIISIHWTFGDGHSSDDQNPTHEYGEPGTYVVCLRIEDNTGCVSEICHEVTVGEQEGCHAAFTWDLIPGTLGVHFFNQSTSEHDIISIHWTFGDGHSSDDQNPSHEYDEPGTYVVCIRIEDNTGCVSEICHEVTVGEQEGCHAAFEWELIPGSLGVHFINHSTSEHDIISIHWTFGDGHSSDDQNPSHEYGEPGTYVVCLRIEDNTGCVSEICHEVTVGEQEGCHASFTWEQIPGTLQIHFHSTSTSSHDIISYQWNFGDGHSGDGSNPYHTYEQPGTYLVCLIITDGAGCVSDVCHEVTVGEPEEGCDAHFNFEINEEGVVFFNNNSTGGSSNTTWLWTFGDGTTSTEENPQHEYNEPGVYTVCLYMTDNSTDCSSHHCETIALAEGGILPEIVGSPLSISNSFNQDFKIFRYTNPAGDELFIDYYLDDASTVLIELYDLAGIRMISDLKGIRGKGKQQEMLDVAHLQPGMYILTVTTGTERKTMGISISR